MIMRVEMEYIRADHITSEEVRNFRKRYGMTQQQLADFMGCSKPTVERWEQNGGVTGTAALVFDILFHSPLLMEERSIPERVLPLRLWYMNGQHVCTLIDVDDINQRVMIRNYTSNILLRAFGKNEHPTYKDYEEFLESRCFPGQRDKMKLILKDLDLPFYDPFMIVKKTEGRMAEDDFWIRIEQQI